MLHSRPLSSEETLPEGGDVARTGAIRVILADGHRLALDGTEHQFTRHPEFVVVHRSHDGDETLRAVRALRPDLLVFDTTLQGLGGLGLAETLAGETLPTRAILFTEAIDDATVGKAIRLGVRGIVLKRMPAETLVLCARKVHAGGLWLETQSAGRLLERLTRRDWAVGSLTARERQTLHLAALGLRNKRIAERLSVCEGTVKLHLHHVYEKLQLAGRQDLAQFAHHNGFV